LEDHGSSPFHVLKQDPRRETFQLARASRKKGANNFFLATQECCLRRRLGEGTLQIEAKLMISQMIMRQSLFFGNQNGIGPEEREYVADTIIEFLDKASKR